MFDSGVYSNIGSDSDCKFNFFVSWTTSLFYDSLIDWCKCRRGAWSIKKFYDPNDWFGWWWYTIWEEGNDIAKQFERSVMVCGISGEPQYIKAYQGCYDPLSYPLFFTRGEAGWNKKILYADQRDVIEGLCDYLWVWFSISLFVLSISSQIVVHDPVDGDVNIGHDHTETQRNDGEFSATYISCTIVFMNFIYDK
jgi:hypothetical protein